MDDNPLLTSLIGAYSTEKTHKESLEKLFKNTLKLTSVFDITRLTETQFKERLHNAIQNDEQLKGYAKSIYDNAKCLAAQISHLYREQRLSDGLAQHQWHPLGIRAVEQQGPSYTNLFKENWNEACKTDSIASIDSPVAYLRALYLFALQLESSTSQSATEKANRILLEKRRPDLADLSIDQQSTFAAQPMLGLVNSILDRNIQKALPPSDQGKSTYDVLAQKSYPFALPYEFFQHQCLLGLSGGKPVLGELNYLISDVLPLNPNRNTQYGNVLETTSDTAQMLMSGLGPKRQALLTETAFAKNTDWTQIYGTASVSDLKKINSFLERTELKAEQLEALLAQGKHAPNTSPNVSTGAPLVHPFGARYVNGPPAENSTSMSLDTETKPREIAHLTEKRLERLHRMIRLQRWLDIPFSDLDTLICSAFESQIPRNQKMQLDVYLMRTLGTYRYLSRRYSITAEEFAALLYQVSPCASGENIPLFDKVFNRARLFDTPLKLDGRTFTAGGSDPDSHTVLQHLSASLGLPLTEDSLLQVVKNTQKHLGSLKCDLHTLSSIYRQVRTARLFGLSITELTTLTNLLAGESISLCLVTGQMPASDMFNVLMQLDWVTRWIKESIFDIPMLQRVLALSDAGDYPLGDLQQHLIQLKQQTRLNLITPQELATLALPQTVDLRADLAKTLLDEKGLVKNFAPGIYSDTSQSLTRAVNTAIDVETLILDEDAGKNLRLKNDCKPKLTNLLLRAHDRQQHLVEVFLQEALLLPMNCAKDVVIWANTSVHQILTTVLESKDSHQLARQLHSLLRHAEVAARLQLSNKALTNLLRRPSWLDTPDGQLRLSFKVLYLFDRFIHFLDAYRQPEESLLSYLELADLRHSGGDYNGRLAQLLSWTTAEVTVLTSNLTFRRAMTMKEIDWVARCHATCKATGLSAAALLKATSLDNASPADQWKTVGEAVMAASH
ncbi:Tc toxin subunit A [Pseudomonas lini]|uniref:Tc toxin subunit A n=1 Tax=Pseudomonas lini TaxID=163011 RepID=UPI00345F07D2